MLSLLRDYLKDFFALNRQCKKFLYLYFIRSVSAGTVFYIAIYLAHIDLTASIIGYEVSSLVLGNLIGSMLATHFLNSNNAFRLSGVGIVAQGISFLCIVLTNSVYLLACSVFFMGLFGYLYKVSSSFLITALSGIDKNSRSSAITFMSVFSNLGLGVGGVLVSVFSEYHAKLLFGFIGLILILASYPYFINGSKLNAIIKENENDNERPNLRFFSFSLLSIFVVGVIYAQQRVGLNIFLEKNFSGYGMSTIILLNSILIIAILPIIRSYLISNASIQILGFGVLLLGMGLFGLKYFHSFFSILFLCVIWTFGEMVASTISQLICFQSATKNKRGKAMGVYKFLYALGTFLGAFVGANILESYTLNSIWIICGIFGVFVFFVSNIVCSKSHFYAQVQRSL